MSLAWITQHRLAVEIPEGLAEALITGLKDYKPLISQIKKGYWEKLGLALDDDLPPNYIDMKLFEGLFPDKDILLSGELFIRDDGSILYFKIPNWEELEVGCITPQSANIDEYWKFIETAMHIITEFTKKKELKWELVTSINQNFWQASKTMEEVSPTELDLKASNRLENPKAHQLLKKIHDVNNILLNQLMDVEDKEEAQKLIQEFEELGLIIKDFVVFCKQHGQQIFRVNSRSAIQDASEKGFSCFLCGKAISEERIDELITCSDYGKTLMNRDYWMPVRLVSCLYKLGIKANQYFVNYGDEDEVDLFLILNNRLIMFELSDKKFGLKNAFLFNAKVATFDVDTAIVISTQKVALVMQKHIQQANHDTEIKFIDNFSGLDEKIENILVKKQKENIITIMEDFSSITSVNLPVMALRSLNPNYKDTDDMDDSPSMHGGEKPKKKKKKKKMKSTQDLSKE